MPSRVNFPSRGRAGRRHLSFALAWGLATVALAAAPRAQAEEISNPTVHVTLETSGAYQIVSDTAAITLEGMLPGSVLNPSTDTGTDRLGSFHRLNFHWQDGLTPMSGSIRIYDQGNLVLFSDTLGQARPKPAAAFPDFRLPRGEWHHFAYKDLSFSPPQVTLDDTFGPWLFFDDKAHAFAISAATHFPTTRITGHQQNHIVSTMAPGVVDLPDKFYP